VVKLSSTKLTTQQQQKWPVEETRSPSRDTFELGCTLLVLRAVKKSSRSIMNAAKDFFSRDCPQSLVKKSLASAKFQPHHHIFT
jgi:hypothetical protein